MSQFLPIPISCAYEGLINPHEIWTLFPHKEKLTASELGHFYYSFSFSISGKEFWELLLLKLSEKKLVICSMLKTLNF
jgi:hypothetical protein